jgi:hypothetical protein
VYNKLEPQLFLLFDCHKYGELGSNAIFNGIDSWEPSAVSSFHPIRLDFHNSDYNEENFKPKQRFYYSKLT